MNKVRVSIPGNIKNRLDILRGMQSQDYKLNQFIILILEKFLNENLPKGTKFIINKEGILQREK